MPYVRLENLLKDCGVTRKELAKRLNCSYTTICNKFTGNTDFRLTEMLIIQGIIRDNSTWDVTLDFIFEMK